LLKSARRPAQVAPLLCAALWLTSEGLADAWPLCAFLSPPEPKLPHRARPHFSSGEPPKPVALCSLLSLATGRPGCFQRHRLHRTHLALSLLGPVIYTASTLCRLCGRRWVQHFPAWLRTIQRFRLSTLFQSSRWTASSSCNGRNSRDVVRLRFACTLCCKRVDSNQPYVMSIRVRTLLQTNGCGCIGASLPLL
jgi:hypothetical protein